MWKTLLLATLLVLASIAAFDQRKRGEQTSFYVFDKNWESCKAGPDAAYMILEDRLDDTVFQIRYYNYTGPLLKVETYADYKKTKPNGFFAYYDQTGKVDSCGYVWMGRKDKTWMYFNDSLNTIRSERYERGKFIEAKDEAQLKAEHEEFKSKVKLDPTGKEAEFKGGEQKWRTWISKNIEFPRRALNMKKGGKVLVRFTVDTEGILSDIWIEQSVEYSLDEESIRLIKKAPAWEPAIRDGKKVRAFRRQPITYNSPG